jgi:uncharacterized phiE125 gp8 family phage protein
MQSDSLTVITPPTEPLISTAAAKVMLRVDHAADDTLITQLIAAAIEEAQQAAARSFVTRTLSLALNEWPSDGVIRLWYPPVTAIVSVKYYDHTNTVQTKLAAEYVGIYDLNPSIIMLAPGASWPAGLRSYSPIRVQYTAGYGAPAAVPEQYKAAVMGLVAVDYENRESLSSQAAAQRENVLAKLKSTYGWAG